MKLAKTAPLEVGYIPFEGGLDVVTPMLAALPGTCRDSQNYVQDINGGYRPQRGYERYDGQAAPSDAAYATLTVTLTGTVAVADVLTDNATTSYGTVIALTTGIAVLTEITGTFTTGNIKVGGAVVGTCTGGQVTDGADTAKLHAQYKNLAADVYRADITAVPGSGVLRGIVTYKDVQYAFRDNAAGTATAMYKSSASGWTLVALGRELSFSSGGTYVVAEGDEIEGEVSGAKATITRIALESGTVAGGDAAGRFIFASQTGTFQAETVKVGANLNVATIAADSSAITFTVPSGRFEFNISNFGGSANTSRVYGCDGKNRGFEFDGTVFVPIATGMTTDAPEHVSVHKNHLFFSFVGSVQHSSTGFPYQWSAITGAAELAMGDQVTGFMPQPGAFDTAALAIFTRDSIGVLYGSSVTDWNLATYKEEAGAIAHTIQKIGGTLMLDDRGITTLTTSERFGNFADSILSKAVQTWLITRRQNVLSSCVMRDQNQYWLFFSDMSGLCVTLDNNKVRGMMPVLFGHVVQCIDSRENSSGEEVIFFGDADGYVHQLGEGTSFDGGEIEAWITLSFNHFKSPTLIKRYRRATFEITGDGYYEFEIDYDLDYESTEREQPNSVSETITLSSSTWDTAYWDVFTWDGVILSPTYLDMTGSGVNLSLKIWSKGDYFNSARFNGALVEYTPMRGRR